MATILDEKVTRKSTKRRSIVEQSMATDLDEVL
jgi:hypothetical protein